VSGPRIWEVRYRSAGTAGRGRPGIIGAHRDKAGADLEADRMNARAADMKLDAAYFVEEIDVTGCFQVPSEPGPRELFTQRWTKVASKPGCWDVADVEVLSGEIVIGRYRRNYPGKPPFEPFRQYCTPDERREERFYALISPHYQETAVMELGTGEIVAREDRKAPGYGFCPVGFYVPDWHDVHDGSVLPGSSFWEKGDEWPDGTLGFVWGCHWGDDNGWKVQALDLSGVAEGIITRDDRFGYLYLDNRGDPGDFIRVDPGEGGRGPMVTFSVPRRYEITGRLSHDGTDAQ
jgi:hypothetical protein